MLLMLIRHARAGDRDARRWPDDRDRPLTEEGREIQARVSRALAEMGLAPDAILTSPWTRADQTARVTVETMRLEIRPAHCEPLAAAPDLDALQAHVGTRSADSIVALVGHSPWMEELASLLLAGDEDRVDVDFPKSGVMGIELAALAAGTGRLRFLLRPGHVRRLGKK
jgi:phosphohistidine phosphatase